MYYMIADIVLYILIILEQNDTKKSTSFSRVLQSMIDKNILPSQNSCIKTFPKLN
jgi:hypothetical protein